MQIPHESQTHDLTLQFTLTRRGDANRARAHWPFYPNITVTQFRPGSLHHYLLRKGQFGVNGFIGLSTMLMAHWTDTKLGLLPRVSPNKLVWTSLTPSLLLLSSPLSRLCLLFLLWEAGIWFNLIWTMPFLMVIYMKRVICSCPKAFTTRGWT